MYTKLIVNTCVPNQNVWSQLNLPVRVSTPLKIMRNIHFKLFIYRCILILKMTLWTSGTVLINIRKLDGAEIWSWRRNMNSREDADAGLRMRAACLHLCSDDNRCKQTTCWEQEQQTLTQRKVSFSGLLKGVYRIFFLLWLNNPNDVIVMSSGWAQQSCLYSLHLEQVCMWLNSDTTGN